MTELFKNLINGEWKESHTGKTFERRNPATGELVGAFGLTEPGGGSDAGSTRTTAVLDGDEWVINGSKAFITNSGMDITGFVTITAVTGTKPDGRKEISTIIVPSGTPGFTVAPKYSKVGWNASDTHELAFTDCRVPAENLLGERGRGYAQFLSILTEGRVAIAAGLGVLALAAAVTDVVDLLDLEQVVFGGPLWARLEPVFLRVVPDAVQARAIAGGIHPIAVRGTRVGVDVAAVGAACLVAGSLTVRTASLDPLMFVLLLGLAAAVPPFATIWFERRVVTAANRGDGWRLAPGRQRPAGPAERLQAWTLRRPALAVLAGVVLVGALTGAALLVGPPVPTSG